jgi:tight adherence protein C
MNWNVLVVLSCTFLAVSGVTYMVFQVIWTVDQRVNARLSGLPRSRRSAGIGNRYRTVKDPSGHFGAKVVALASRLFPNDQRERSRMQARLMHAGIYAPWATGVFLTVKLLLIGAPPLVALLIAELGFYDPNKALLFGGLAGGLGIILPGLWLGRRKARRQALLCRSLPDLLDLTVACVQSGLSLEAALQRVTDELALAYPLLAGEMAIVQRQIEMGATPDLALRGFAERSDLSALFSLSSLIEQARRFGTSIVDALRAQAEMLRYQREQRAEELAQKAAVKILFPTLLFIFPAIFVVLVGPAAVRLYEIFSANAVRSN